MYEKRRAVLKAIPKFWPVALMNSEMFALQAVHYDDQHALSYLEDLWLVRNPVETRAFTLEFVSGIPLIGTHENTADAYLVVCVVV